MKKEILVHVVLETIMQNFLKKETTFSLLKCSLFLGFWCSTQKITVRLKTIHHKKAGVKRLGVDYRFP